MKIRLARDPLAILVAASRTSDVTPLLGGRRPVFLVGGPASVQHVLQLQSRLFVRRPIASIQALLGESIVLQDGESWFAHRRMLQPAFHRPHLATMTQATEAHITAWLAPWAAQPGLELADLGQAMRELTRRLLAAALFSTSMSQEVSDQLGADVSICLDHTTAQIMRPWNIPAWVPTPARRRFVAARTRVETILLACVQQRRTDPHPPSDLLTMLAQAQDADTGEFMTDDALRSELMTTYLAGHESTAQVLTFLWLQLAQHPDVLARVRAEVAAVRTSDVPLHQALGTCTYMRQVLAETMRLFPPIYVTRRTATEEVVLGGVPIPAAMILISPYATHRLPVIWPDPERFDPERFADDRVSRTDGSYLPFLVGPKRCIGEHLAVQTMLLVLALIAEQFTLTPQRATVHVRTGATLQISRMPTTVCRRTLTSV